MNTIKRHVRLIGFTATLAAGLVLSAAIDGAGAKNQAREGSGANSSSIRTEIRSIPEKPVETGAIPVGNSPPIIAKPDHGDKPKYGRKHHHDYKNDQGHQVVYECLYPPCPKYVPRRGWLTKLRYVAPGSKPIPIDPGTGYGTAPARGGGSGVTPSASTSKKEQ